MAEPHPGADETGHAGPDRIREFFEPINLLANLQLDDRLWLDAVPENPERRPFVLYLGCNVLRTAHMIPLVIAILRRLGVDFTVVGGPAACCGTIHHHGGEVEAGAQIGRHTTAALERFRPDQVLMWCPSCTHHFQAVLSPAQGVPFDFGHITEFLADRIRSVPLAPQERRVAIHAHGGLVQQENDAQSACRLLQAIPGLQVVPTRVYPQLGVQCNEAVRERMGRDRYDAMVREYAQEVVRQGADTLVTIYHGCQRMLCATEAVYPFRVESYVSVLARSLGIEDVEDKFKRWTLARDEDVIYADVADRARSLGLREARVRKAIRQQFLEP